MGVTANQRTRMRRNRISSRRSWKNNSNSTARKRSIAQDSLTNESQERQCNACMHEVACPSMEHSGQHASTRGDMQVRCAKFWV